MDWLDKRIITRLLGNCRESFRNIAREFRVTCPTIIARANRLRQWGVIQRYIAELSQEMMGVEWYLAELKTDGTESQMDLFQQFEANECIGEVMMLGKGRYLILAEIAPSERSGFESCISKLDGIESFEVDRISPVANGVVDGSCKYTSSGGRTQLDEHQLKVLKYLAYNARMSITEISDLTGFSPKMISETIHEFQECSGINLTLRLNLPSSGGVNFMLKYRLNERSTGPKDAAEFMTDIYPEEHWFTFYNEDRSEMLHYMTVKHVKDLGFVSKEISNLPYAEDVNARIIFSTMKSEGRMNSYLIKNIGNLSAESRETSYFLDKTAHCPSSVQVNN
ncbi:MAG: AsnC family transcriptional regulator [Candidatus Thorarchaeota archaeon]